MTTEFLSFLATQDGKAGVVGAFATRVCSGEAWLVRRDCGFHDLTSLASLDAALAAWSRSRSTTGARTRQPATSRRGRRSVALRAGGGEPGPKRRVRMQVRATPGKGPGTGQAVVSTLNLAYDIGFGFTEMILPGCFANSIAAHPRIPLFWNHLWDSAPVGVGEPSEQGDKLVIDFELFLGQGDLVDRVYSAMKANALEEWSVGFWAIAITTDPKMPQCDQIAEGDLAEASVCVRGANPETGTLELASRRGWLMGDERERRREVEVVKRATRQLVAAR